MFQKTQKLFNRSRAGKHTEQVLEDSYWLFGFVLLYRRENIVSHNLS